MDSISICRMCHLINKQQRKGFAMVVIEKASRRLFYVKRISIGGSNRFFFIMFNIVFFDTAKILNLGFFQSCMALFKLEIEAKKDSNDYFIFNN